MSLSFQSWSISARLKPADGVACNNWPEASFRTEDMSLILTASLATSPVAKEHSAEQPKGTPTLWNDLRLAEKYSSCSDYRAKERWLDFFQTNWIVTYCQIIMGYLPDYTKINRLKGRSHWEVSLKKSRQQINCFPLVQLTCLLLSCCWIRVS